MATCSARLVHIIAESYAVKGKTCSTTLIHIIAESYAVKGKRSPWKPVLQDWSTSLQRVMLSKVRGLHDNLFY